MKTFREFILEASEVVNAGTQSVLANRATGRIGGFVRNLIDPSTGPTSKLATSLVRDVVSPKLPKQIQPAVRGAAPLVGTLAGMAKYAPHVSAVLTTFNQGTAKGRVRTGTDQAGKPIYMAK